MPNKSSTTEQTSKHLIVEIDKKEYDRLKEHEYELRLIKEELNNKQKLDEQLYSLLNLLVENQTVFQNQLLVQNQFMLQQNPNQQAFPIQPTQISDVSILEMSSVFGNVFQQNVQDTNDKTVKPEVKFDGAYEEKRKELLQRKKLLATKTKI